MSKKPTVKPNLRRTSTRSAGIEATEVDSHEASESEVESDLPEEAPVEAMAEEAAPVEALVIDEAAEAGADTPEVPHTPEAEPEASEPEVQDDQPAPAKPVRARAAPRKAADKPETAPEITIAVTPSPVIEPITEVEAPAVEVSAETPLPTEPAAQPRWTTIFAKEFTMSTFPSFDFAAPFQTAFSDLQEKAKAAYEKGQSALGDYSEFTKGNVEALVESGKILAAGLQELTSAYVSEGRSTFETLTAEVKELAAAKSPTDFLKLQNDIAKKHFDGAVAAASKHSEALVKLANEAAQPISNRVTLAVEKVKTAA